MTFYSLTTWSSARTKKENRSRGIGQRKGVVERGGGGGWHLIFGENKNVSTFIRERIP